MRSAFDDWWDSDYDDSTNPYTKDSACYWAWAGWQAAKAESRSYREAYPDNFVKEWVGLTIGETAIIVKMLERGNFMVAIAAVEAKLKEKNT